MNDSAEGWSFSAGFDALRRVRLEVIESFEFIVECIYREMQVTRFEICRGKTGYLKNCLRLEFTFTVSPETFDAFFNSPCGYRAQYLRDPDVGQMKNGQLIRRLVDRLVADARGKPTKHQMPEARVMVSLLCCSAKIWIPESSINFDHSLIQDISVEAWCTKAREAAEAYGPSTMEQEKAIWGIRAPTGTSLEVKGAFLDSEGYEVVHPEKVLRRFDIHRYGWA
jgi:hypothetical protein